MPHQPTKADKRLIESIVAKYKSDEELVNTFLQSVLLNLNSKKLKPHIHSIKWRLKDPDHLRDKLLRKLALCKENGRDFDYTPENVFTKITDLAGIRVIHLHTRQIELIDKFIKQMLTEQTFALLEGPSARTWDDEYRKLFKEYGISIQKSETMYTSVHYVVGSNSRQTLTCEIQVRTLMEEVWGEVDHSINYPHPIKSVACKEQIRALARATSSATRLVDAIFATHKDLTTNRRLNRRSPG